MSDAEYIEADALGVPLEAAPEPELGPWLDDEMKKLFTSQIKLSEEGRNLIRSQLNFFCMPCPLCSAESSPTEWHVARDMGALKLGSNRQLPFVAFTCTNCGNLQMLNINVVVKQIRIRLVAMLTRYGDEETMRSYRAFQKRR